MVISRVWWCALGVVMPLGQCCRPETEKWRSIVAPACAEFAHWPWGTEYHAVRPVKTPVPNNVTLCLNPKLLIQ